MRTQEIGHLKNSQENYRQSNPEPPMLWRSASTNRTINIIVNACIVSYVFLVLQGAVHNGFP
jgi:hypothetical protein